MKNLIFPLLLISALFSAKAQFNRVEYLQNFDKKTFHWGYYISINQIGFRNIINEEYVGDPTNSFGFNVGLVGDLKLNKNINLRLEPGMLSSADKGFTPPSSEEPLIWNSTYLHLPLLFKFSTDRLQNYRPFVLAGVSYDYNFKNTPDEMANKGYFINKNQFMLEYGIGMDFYLHYFKFSPSIRGIYSLTNELNSVYFESGMKLQTRGIFLSLCFE
jgi:hypothetical protein